MIWVVNFPFCNFFSLERYLRVTSRSFSILRDGDTPSNKDIIILPGVGTFGQGMDFLKLSCLESLLVNHVSLGGKVVGICLGMQLFFQTSSESPGVEGLGLINGACERIPVSSFFAVPHIGWNALVFPETLHNCFLQFGKPLGLSMSDYYFVHSYYAKTNDPDSVIATFEHPTGLLAAAVAMDNVIGFQFHPEKSGPSGYALLDQILVL